MARCKQTARQSTGGKAPDTSLPPRLLEEWPLHRGGLKSLIVIVLALLHFAKSAATKKHRSSYPQGAIPAPCKGSSAGFK
eukprot:CCRYP_014119-RA/>CCRYP_014119-RA protein AED:0.22 eAED:0.22 QI:0/-1/0/1/-1/0/1/0/79